MMISLAKKHRENILKKKATVTSSGELQQVIQLSVSGEVYDSCLPGSIIRIQHEKYELQR